MFLIYKTDVWHSLASRNLIGVASSPEMVMFLCNKQVKKEGETLDEDQIFNLGNMLQTQGYSGEGEFDIDHVDIDVLL